MQKLLLRVLFFLCCINTYAQKYEVGANWGLTSPAVNQNGFPNKLYEIKGSYNINKHFQTGLIIDYYPGIPYKFIPPSEFFYNDHGFMMGWDPNSIINYPDFLLIATTNIINPKVYYSIKSNFRKIYFSLGASIGYVHATGLPSGGLLPLVDATITNSGYEGKNDFLNAYKKAMRPGGGYSLGVFPGISFYPYKNIGVNAALNIEYLNIRNPKFAINRSWSIATNYSISPRFGSGWPAI